MSVLIKGMEMPKDCLHCPFSYMSSDCLKIWIICKVKDVSVTDGDAVKEGRPDWCPLVEVPPHGDLIDRDALCEYIEDLSDNMWTNNFGVSEQRLFDAPTIIEAEEET